MTLYSDPAGDHPALGVGEWWACEHPERPVDGTCSFWHECAACRLAFAVAAVNWPNSTANVETHEAGFVGLAPGQHPVMEIAKALARSTGDPRMAAALGMD